MRTVVKNTYGRMYDTGEKIELKVGTVLGRYEDVIDKEDQMTRHERFSSLLYVSSKETLHKKRFYLSADQLDACIRNPVAVLNYTSNIWDTANFDLYVVTEGEYSGMTVWVENKDTDSYKKPSDNKMKVFTAYFGGVWLTGNAVVVAEDIEQAYKMICTEVENKGLSVPDKSSIKEIDITQAGCTVIFDGDY